MNAKNKSEKILARKKISLIDKRGNALEALHYREAMELVRSNRRAGDYALGNYYLKQIASKVTDVSEPTVYLLYVYLDSMLLEEAEQLCTLLRKGFPTDSSALRARARYHEFAGDLQEAESLLQKAVRLHPGNADNLNALAEMYQSTGDSEGALACYSRALRVDPKHSQALFGKARLLGANADSEFIAQIKAAIASRKFSGANLAALYFALAFIYADIDIDLHFEYLHEANRISTSVRNFDVLAAQKTAENVLYRFREPAINALRELIADDSKPIFIVGMPRSGTTLLEQILGAHPQCQPIGESGTLAYAIETADKLGCPPLDASSPQAVELCRRYLLRIGENFKNHRLMKAAGEKRVVSKSMGEHMLLGLAFLALPNARVIHMRRHPLAIIYSCYQQNFASQNNFSFNLEWLAEYYKLFETLMTHWRTVCPEKILTVHYESLVRDKKTEIEKILKFCALDWSDTCIEHEKSVRTKMVLTSSDMQVRRPVYKDSLDKWKKVEPHLEPVKQLLGEWLNYLA